ncbi:hypothetical protein GGS24DRAFT_492545 [Hypoxylon argillaceum]|nr:hypothetical protein GGS24DRAFT_492545 [Hypoxylon argillaceum]
MAFFVDHQWKFLPLVLVERKFRYETFDQTRLPFIQIDQLPETSKSGHSCVQKNTIHRDCFQIKIETAIDQHMNPYVAYKTLNSNAIREAEKEASVLETIREIENAHLVKAIAYIYDDKKTKHSFLFPWAEYGNLRDFWNQQTPSRDRKYFVNAFRQLTCLASALDDLSDKNIRHGDLKPENIVCFRTDNGLPVGDSEDMVRLVIIDVGISKKHHNDTSDRRATETKVSTRRYAAPELETKTEKERSRRADVWSLGCIFLEFVIWLLYGNDELKHFTKHFDEGSGNMKFFVIDSEHLQTPQMKTAIRHPEVGKTIAKITADPRCPSGTGIRRLVDLISDRLLAVDLSDEDPPKPKLNSEGYSICRCVYNKAMDQVVNSIHNCDPGIKSISEPKPTPPPPGPEISIEAPSVPSEKASQPTTGGRPYARPLNDLWDYSGDDHLARKVITNLSPNAISLLPNTNSILCYRCDSLKLWSLTCRFSDSVAGLEEKANKEGCVLCGLLLQNVQSRGDRYQNQQVNFERVNCYLAIEGDRSQPVANLYTTLCSQIIHLQDIQVGFPELPAARKEIHFKILREWIRDCDHSHQCYPAPETFLPTRLLIINENPDDVQLIVTSLAHTNPGRYVALSHRWGPPQQDTYFCTYRSNIEELKRGIKISSLPRAFQDAVCVTRGLGLKYLWIDSLCIIQQDPVDWEVESTLMERVFSSAYCTIAASCSSGSKHGFLIPRPPRQLVKMRGPEGYSAPYFVCETIDDFSRDVDQSELNQRGWVLQERALSRRTIYFTERQSYWEIREVANLETYYSNRASFLGDSNFPHAVDQYVKGRKIELFQDLYTRYSGLALTVPSDRPIAIRGLESRLLNTFNTTGAFGIFGKYLHRSLLRQRAGDSLETIIADPPLLVPSCADHGPIRYLDVPFGEVTWSEAITSPFAKGAQNDIGKNILATPLEIEAPIWSLTGVETEHMVIDEPSRVFNHPIHCVVLGTKRTACINMSPIHWVLLVHLSTDEEGADVYTRVGVAVLEKGQISFDMPRGRKRVR